MGDNRMQEIFDYRNKRATRANPITTVDLDSWLQDKNNQESIYNMRCFYIIKPNADDIVKFGIAGLDGGKGAYGRLRQYINEYGTASDLNVCSGVRLLYLAGNKYNSRVETTNSIIYQKELACKDYFRDTAIRGRGFERILQSRLDELFKIVDDTSNKLFVDVETERRKSERLKQAEVTDEDKIIRIISHDTKGGKSKAKTKYLVEWSRPYILTEKKRVQGKIETTVKEVNTTYESYKHLILFEGGDKAYNIYKTLHPNTTFRN